jgi:hypothetical protein
MGFTIECDIRGIFAWQRNSEAYVIRAMKAAGTSALRAMKAEASRRIRDKKGIQAGKIDSALTMVFPTNKPVWALVAKAKPIPLMSFGARQTKTGVSVEVTKGKRSIIRHAFLATMQSGHKGVFMREGPRRIASKGKYRGKLRQPILERFTAPVSSVVKQSAPEVLKRGETVFRDTFNRLTKGR